MAVNETKGFWKGDNLWWRIGAEEISDRDLRTWVYHNMQGVSRYVGQCVLKMHTDAYANRQNRSETREPVGRVRGERA